MLVIGLTGGIGSGKSLACDIFKQLGVPVIDADVIAKQMTEQGTHAFHQIHKHFGHRVVQENKLDRRQLRNIIFSAPNERLWLENLLHPIIEQEIIKQMSVLHAPYCILAVPLLLEVTPYSFIDRILVIDADEKTQVKRVIERDNVSEVIVHSMMGVQINRSDRLSQADDIIDNNSDVTSLVNQVTALHQQYLKLSSHYL